MSLRRLLNTLRGHRWFWPALGLGLGLGLLAVVELWVHRVAVLEAVAYVRAHFTEWLQVCPPWLFCLCFAVLPALGFPLSVFYLTASTVLGGAPQAVAAAWVCVALNLSLAFLLGRGIFHPILARLLERLGYRIPQFTNGGDWMVILAIRLSPAPYFMQSYLLSLGGVPYSRYMLLSWPVQGLVCIGMILVGRSLFQGGFGYALLGMGLIFLAGVGMRYLRRRSG